MHLNLIKIKVLLLLLVLESQGGLIDGVVDGIKSTKDGLTQDVKNVWSYGKSFVVSEPVVEEKKERGLIGSWMHSAKEKIHSLHERLWTVDDIPNDSGLLWGMYNRFTQRLSKAKHFILGDDAILFNDTIHQLYNPDGTIKVGVDKFKESILNLQHEINEKYKAGNKPSSVDYGEGSIDVRLGDISKDFEDNAAGVANDIQDKVASNTEAVKDNTGRMINAIPDNLRKNVNDGMETMKDGLKQVNDDATNAQEKYLLGATGN